MTSVTNEAAGRSVRAPPSLERGSEPERSQPDENAEQVTSCCTLVVAPSLMFRYVCHASFNPLLLLPNFPRAFRAEDRKQQSQRPQQCSVAIECGDSISKTPMFMHIVCYSRVLVIWFVIWFYFVKSI